MRKANENSLAQMNEVIEKNKKLNKSLILAQNNAEKGQVASKVINNLIQDGTLKHDE